MVGYIPFTVSLLALAFSRNNPRTQSGGSTSKNPRRPPSSSSDPNSSTHRKKSPTGRDRYGRSGRKNGNRNNNDPSPAEPQPRLEAPPLSLPNGPRATYFTCRHTYETTLMDELAILLTNEGSSTMSDRTSISTPAPGLVRIIDEGSSNDSLLLDPVYALQTLPNCVVVSATSIKGLAQAVVQKGLLGEKASSENDDSLDIRSQLLREAFREAPRSSLAIHGLVPGMFKGQKNPVMEHRSQKIAEELTGILRKGYPAARKQRNQPPGGGDAASSSSEEEQGNSEPTSNERWILQVLLMTPDVAAASLVRCSLIGDDDSLLHMSSEDATSSSAQEHFQYWPNWQFPAGLAKVDITTEVMPSSAYRKLMEAMECMGLRPHQSSRVYDLGACPGGWTWVLRYFLNCNVVAIDRSELDPRLMQDSRVEFVKGDAFSFEPTGRDDVGDVWMVSDVIAFPDRILELLERWCGGKWATYMVVTMKFHGSQPDFPALQQAIDLAKHNGYECRAKHFFNNKNEVTLMLKPERSTNGAAAPRPLEPGILGIQMYPVILP